jgi:hypothetical protein
MAPGQAGRSTLCLSGEERRAGLLTIPGWLAEGALFATESAAIMSKKELEMTTLMDALNGLAPVQDAELVESYRRYVACLETILTPEQCATYAELIQHTGVVRVFDTLTPDELANLEPDEAAIATAIIADGTTTLENRRVASLLNQQGLHELAPDLSTPVAHAALIDPAANS